MHQLAKQFDQNHQKSHECTLYHTSPSEFIFELSAPAALHNLAILEKYNYDLGKALGANKTHPLAMGQSFDHQANSRNFWDSILYGHEWKPS
jgi:hypothetical protein